MDSVIEPISGRVDRRGRLMTIDDVGVVEHVLADRLGQDPILSMMGVQPCWSGAQDTAHVGARTVPTALVRMRWLHRHGNGSAMLGRLRLAVSDDGGLDRAARAAILARAVDSLRSTEADGVVASTLRVVPRVDDRDDDGEVSDLDVLFGRVDR